MEQLTAFVGQVLNGLVDFTVKNLIFLLPPMVLITAVIQSVREGAARIWGDVRPVVGSPLDRARRIGLFSSPYVCGIIYMWTISGWVAPVYEFKAILFGGIAIGGVNAILYDWIISKMLAKWKKKSEVKDA